MSLAVAAGVGYAAPYGTATSQKTTQSQDGFVGNLEAIWSGIRGSIEAFNEEFERWQNDEDPLRRRNKLLLRNIASSFVSRIVGLVDSLSGAFGRHRRTMPEDLSRLIGNVKTRWEERIPPSFSLETLIGDLSVLNGLLNNIMEAITRCVSHSSAMAQTEEGMAEIPVDDESTENFSKLYLKDKAAHLERKLGYRTGSAQRGQSANDKLQSRQRQEELNAQQSTRNNKEDGYANDDFLQRMKRVEEMDKIGVDYSQHFKENPQM